MCSPSPESRRCALHLCCVAWILAVSGPLIAPGAGASPARVLRVAADPNNLPFSNARREGFENRILALVAREMRADVEYSWRAQRRGFFRETMKSGNCQLVAGVPVGFDPVLTTRPYYRSGYVLVRRATGPHPTGSLDDPLLRSLTLGVQMIGDDFANTPPAHSLARRGIIQNVRGYSVYGDYRQPNPPTRIVHAVAQGEIDAAYVWGPLAGFVAREHPGQLELVALPAGDELTRQSFVFDIAMGVRRDQPGLRDELNDVLARLQPAIDAILQDFGVPRIAR